MTEPAAHPRNRTWMAKLEFQLTRAESFVAIAGLVLLLGISLTEIGARNFFHSSIPGADVLDRYLVLWVSFLGAVLAVRGRHIKIDALAVWFPDAWRRPLERPIFLFSTLVCGGLFWAAARFWREEWLHAPATERWITALAVILPLSFFLLTVHFALRFLIGPRAPGRP